MSSVSVTQALSELKLLRSRIQHATNGAHLIAMKKKRDMLDSSRFATEARASYQSFTDLLARYNQLKAAIVLSNATTSVKIGDKTYTVADAVERKRTIDFEKAMLNTMKQQFEQVKREHESHTVSEQARVERLLQSELSKDSKTNVEVITQLTETFLAQNKAEILDPLNLETKIAEMNRQIEEFETKVDWVLSESNGRTVLLSL
uniref:Uncharacterized protein n=1 Tax=viral metagenome TaxID=1070528 RepID=A0A6C0AQD0_9ZZZZ